MSYKSETHMLKTYCLRAYWLGVAILLSLVYIGYKVSCLVWDQQDPGKLLAWTAISISFKFTWILASLYCSYCDTDHTMVVTQEKVMSQHDSLSWTPILHALNMIYLIVNIVGYCVRWECSVLAVASCIVDATYWVFDPYYGPDHFSIKVAATIDDVRKIDRTGFNYRYKIVSFLFQSTPMLSLNIAAWLMVFATLGRFLGTPIQLSGEIILLGIDVTCLATSMICFLLGLPLRPVLGFNPSMTYFHLSIHCVIIGIYSMVCSESTDRPNYVLAGVILTHMLVAYLLTEWSKRGVPSKDKLVITTVSPGWWNFVPIVSVLLALGFIFYDRIDMRARYFERFLKALNQFGQNNECEQHLAKMSEPTECLHLVGFNDHCLQTIRQFVGANEQFLKALDQDAKSQVEVQSQQHAANMSAFNWRNSNIDAMKVFDQLDKDHPLAKALALFFEEFYQFRQNDRCVNSLDRLAANLNKFGTDGHCVQELSRLAKAVIDFREVSNGSANWAINVFTEISNGSVTCCWISLTVVSILIAIPLLYFLFGQLLVLDWEVACRRAYVTFGKKKLQNTWGPVRTAGEWLLGIQYPVLYLSAMFLFREAVTVRNNPYIDSPILCIALAFVFGYADAAGRLEPRPDRDEKSDCQPIKPSQAPNPDTSSCPRPFGLMSSHRDTGDHSIVIADPWAESRTTTLQSDAGIAGS